MGEHADMERAADDDREDVVSELRGHLLAGRLSVDEFAERVDAAYSAVTVAQLDSSLQDLPPLPAPRQARRGPRIFPGIEPFSVRFYATDSSPSVVEKATAALFPPLAGAGYEIESRDASTVVFAYDERPAWTILVAVFLFPLGLIALAHRDRRRVVIGATAMKAGETALDVYGRAPSAVRRAVRDFVLGAG